MTTERAGSGSDAPEPTVDAGDGGTRAPAITKGHVETVAAATAGVVVEDVTGPESAKTGSDGQVLWAYSSVYLRNAVYAGLEDVTGAAQATRSMFREVSSVLNLLRAPIIVSLVGFLAFAMPGQTMEIYRLFAEDLLFEQPGGGSWLRTFAFFAMLMASGYVIWYISRILTLTDDDAHTALYEANLVGRVTRWAPRWLSALPAFGVSIGMARVAAAEEIEDVQLLLAAGAVIALLIAGMRLWASYRRTKGDPYRYDDLRQSWLRWDMRVLLAILMLGCIGYLMTSAAATLAMPIETPKAGRALS
ncbi:MAG: hypothetical protein AAFV62_07950, partial [Pseudomonadota bacterium]